MFHPRLLGAAALTTLLALPATPAAAGTTSRMVGQINSARAAHGLPALRESASIDRSSAAWARRLMRQDRLVHVSLGSAGVDGEVLEMHSGTSSKVAGTVRAWLNSPGHRAILLSRRFHVIGVGNATGDFGGMAATVWVGRFR
jgi:uncharacterized protein YkwD